MSVCLSVCPPSAVDFSTGSNESEKNHCCNGDDGRARVSPALQTYNTTSAGFRVLIYACGENVSIQKIGKIPGSHHLEVKIVASTASMASRRFRIA